MKLRITELRGKYRVQQWTEPLVSVEELTDIDTQFKLLPFPHIVKTARYEFKGQGEDEWQFLAEDGYRCRASVFDHLKGVWINPPKLAEFDSLEQANDFIKEHFGLKGLNAVEKPDWKQV